MSSSPYTPNPDRSLVRRLQPTDEQRASVFNQSYQAIVDYLQLASNTLSQLVEQVAAINVSVTNLQNNYNAEASAFATAQSAASTRLATATAQNATVTSNDTAYDAAVDKIAIGNTRLTNSETNFNSVSALAQPYNAFLTAIGGLTRPANSIFTVNGAGSVGWQASVGQSFIMEMGYICLDRSLGVLGGNSAVGAQSTVPVNTKVFVNMRNAIGLEEVTLNTSNNTITVPCTGGNCTYYVFSLATFCGIGGGNSRLMLDTTVVANGSTVQSIAGQSTEANDFNQTSSGFGRFTVGSSSPQLRLESLVQANHPTVLGAALGRPVGGNSTLERYASLLLLRRRML